MFAKQIVIDGRQHLIGRLASVVAKELLSGQSVVVTRCEQIEVSGNFYRNKLKFMAFLRKKHLTNPKRGVHVLQIQTCLAMYDKPSVVVRAAKLFPCMYYVSFV